MKAANVLTTREASMRLGISLRRLMALLAEGKLPGSYKVGLIRQIPEGAVEDRIKEKARFYAAHNRLCAENMGANKNFSSGSSGTRFQIRRAEFYRCWQCCEIRYNCRLNQGRSG
jgi:excisionase family DNA binding protein